MRLIDADVLLKCIPSEEIASRMAVANSPTVEAIPVEYIESTLNRWKEIIGYEESVDALKILVDNWKGEKKEE